MSWSKLEDTYYDDQKFRRLSEILKLGDRLGDERGMVLAQGFVSRLWSWAARHAPDGYLLESSVSTADIERVCGWKTASGRLVAGMIAAGFIDETAAGLQTVRIIHRFWERAESNKRAIQKKKEREDRERVARQSEPQAPPVIGSVGPRGERGERGERGDVIEEAPAIHAKSFEKGKPMAPFVLAEFRRQGMEYNRPLPDNHDKRDEWAAADIYVKYPSRWKPIIAAYMYEEFYERYGWSLQNLAKNIDQIANRTQQKEMTDADVPF